MLPPYFLTPLIHLNSWASTSTDHALQVLIDEAERSFPNDAPIVA